MSINARYTQSYRAIQKRRASIYESIIRLNKKYNALDPSWSNLVMEPLAKALVRHFPGYRAEVLGPFGLQSEYAIHFYHKDDTARPSLSINFVRAGDHLELIDVTQNTHRFPKGSVADINGMNHPRMKIPTAWTIKDLAQYVK